MYNIFNYFKDNNINPVGMDKTLSERYPSVKQERTFKTIAYHMEPSGWFNALYCFAGEALKICNNHFQLLYDEYHGEDKEHLLKELFAIIQNIVKIRKIKGVDSYGQYTSLIEQVKYYVEAVLGNHFRMCPDYHPNVRFLITNDKTGFTSFVFYYVDGKDKVEKGWLREQVKFEKNIIAMDAYLINYNYNHR